MFDYQLLERLLADYACTAMGIG
jgi:hypothetical protein